MTVPRNKIAVKVNLIVDIPQISQELQIMSLVLTPTHNGSLVLSTQSTSHNSVILHNYIYNLLGTVRKSGSPPILHSKKNTHDRVVGSLTIAYRHLDKLAKTHTQGYLHTSKTHHDIRS